MIFIGRLPSGTSINAPAAFLLGCFVACGVTTARAADLCLTLPQARAIHPNEYLSIIWMAAVDVGAHQPQQHGEPPGIGATRKHLRYRRRVRRCSGLALASEAKPVDAALFTPEPATAWPLLIDVDEITAGPVADCCWPALDEPPFTDRWFALPSNWFAAVTQ